MAPRRSVARWCWSAPWASSRRRATSSTSGDHRLYRLCPRRLPRPEGVRPRLWRRALDRPARDVGHLPRDELPHRLEALHVQPDPAASAGRRARAGAGGVGRRRQGRAAERRRALRRRRCPTRKLEIVKALRPLRRHGAARGARQARHRLRHRYGSRRHAPDVFHRAADVGLLRAGRPRLRRHRADVLQQALRSGRGLPALQRIHRAIHAGRGGRRRRHHAERAPQRAVLHAGQGQHLRRDPRRR